MPYFCLKPCILLLGALVFFSLAKISFALSIDAPFYAEKSNLPSAETANNGSTIKHPLVIQYFLRGQHHLSISGHQHLKPGNIQINTHVNVSSSVHFPGNINKPDKERPCDDRTTTMAIPVSTSAPSEATTKGSVAQIESATSQTTTEASSRPTTTDSASVTVPFTTAKVPVTTVTSEATTIAQTTTQTPLPTTTTTSTLPRPLSPIITPIKAPASGDSTEMGIRRQRVYELMRTAWTYYETYEWGKDRIRPIDGPAHLIIPGRHIIASLSSLYVMGFHAQFNKAKQYLETTFQFTPESETLNEDLYGSLLSSYALTGDALFLRKATEFANKSGTFPVPKPGASIEHPFYSWANRKLEFQYLSDLTGNASYLEKLGSFENFMSSLNEQTKISQTYGLSMVMDVKTALQTPSQSLGPYYEKVENLLANGGIVQKTIHGTKYSYGSNPSNRKNSFGYCAYGAMLALGAKEDPSKSSQLELAKDLTSTCFKVQQFSSNAIPYDGFIINDNGQITRGNDDIRHIPRLAESYFVLWRLTGDRKYQNYADQLVQALKSNWLPSKDYYGLSNTGYSPAMLSATLKYLYLTFSPVDYLPLDRWVFDAAGHPLPICGKNDAYPSCTNWNKQM